MALSERLIKDEIVKKWDFSSERYDGHHGHGIKSDEEAVAWAALFRQVIPGKRLKVLDVGCGTGEISLVLAGMGHRVTGLDLSEKMLDRAKAKAKMMADEHGKLSVEFKKGDAENLPFAAETFDAVVTRHVLWTLPNPQKAVNNWKSALKKDGRAVVIDCVWNDGKLGTLLRRKLAFLLIQIRDGYDIAKNVYSAELNAALPNARGVPAERSIGYLREAGLKDIQLIKLDDLISIQKKHMPFRYRISYKYGYYAVHGRK